MKKMLTGLLIIGFFSPSKAIVVGSNTTPSRQGTFTFPAADNDNEIRGFAAFENGFTLEDATTSCLYNAFFPISGPITLNGGAFNLATDLTFSNTTLFINGGTFNVAGQSLKLPSTKQTFTLQSGTVFVDADLTTDSDLFIMGDVTFEGTNVFHGASHTIDLSQGNIVIAPNSSLVIQHCVIDGVSIGKIDNAASTSELILESVKLILDGSYSFTQGSLDIIDTVVITGEQAFGFESDQNLTVQDDATLFFDINTTFSYNPNSSSRDLVKLVGNKSSFHLFEASLYSTTTGIRFTKGQLIIESECDFYSDATVDAEAIAFGDGVSASNDVDVSIISGSGLVVHSGIIVNNNVA